MAVCCAAGEREAAGMRIEVFTDYICPFCYVGIETLRAVAPELPPFTVEWKGFQIHPEYPASGVPLEERMRQYGPERYRAVWQSVLSLARDIGLEMSPPPLLTSSLVALETTEHAKERGREEVFSRAVYRAYFQEGRNIGDPEVNLSLALEAGLDPQEVQLHLQHGTYAGRIEAVRREAAQKGVSGVPTFLVGAAQIVGAQAARVFVQTITRAVERGLA